jgi:hypothetical protein
MYVCEYTPSTFDKVWNRYGYHRSVTDIITDNLVPFVALAADVTLLKKM